MHVTYGQSLGNYVEAKKNNSDTFRNRRLPHRRTFKKVDHSLPETDKN